MGEELLFLSLEAGFRHLDPQLEIDLGLTHTQHHLSMADIVFGSQQGEVIADLLYAWTSRSLGHWSSRSLSMCARHLVDLPNPNSSPRLRQLIMRSIEFIGHQGFGEVGVENLVGFLNRLSVGIDNMGSGPSWKDLLLEIIKSREGRDRLSYSYWELLVEFSLRHHGKPRDLTSYDPQIIISLQDTQEWDRLACWVCFVWMEWSLRLDGMLGDLERGTTLLFRQLPGSIRKLEEWMGRSGGDIPMAFQQICKQGRLEAEQRGILL